MIIRIEKIFFKTYLNPKVKSPKIMTFVRHVQTPSNLGPMGPFLPAIIPNKGFGAGAGALAALNSQTEFSSQGKTIPKVGISSSTNSNTLNASTTPIIPPLKGNFTTITEKVQTNHCTPQKTVQKGPFTPTSRDDKLIEEAKNLGIVKFEDSHEKQDGQIIKYKEAEGPSLTKNGIVLYGKKIHEPDLVEKNSPLTQDFVNAAEEKKTDDKDDIKSVVPPIMPIAGILQSDSENLVLHPSQTHVAIVCSENNNFYVSIGVLTSAKTGTKFISPTQIHGNMKNQFFKSFAFPKIVHKEQFQIHKEATAFIQKKDIAEAFKKEYRDFILKCSHLEIYNPKMLTVESLEKMIHYTVEEKKNEGQIKKNSINDSSHTKNNNIHTDDE